MKLLVFLLLAANAAANAAGDPGAAALDFLEKVREGKLNLEPGGDTALTPQTAEDKRREIARRLDRMVNDLGSGMLEVGAVREDENLAAVLVRKIGGFDPAGLQVFPVALVKRGARWAAAPVPASFENAGLGYAANLRQRLEALETWMLREQVLDLAKLRDQSAARMRAEIEKRLPRETYRAFNPEEVGVGFLKACEQGDLASMLGFLGGMRETLPQDWAARLKAADEAAAAGKDANRPWRLLISPEVVRVVVHTETGGDSGLVSVACLDPADGERRRLPRIRIVHLDMDKSGGLWQVNLPYVFYHGESDENEDDLLEDTLDSELLEAFPENLRLQHPANHQPTGRAAFDATLAAMRAPDLIPLLSLIEIGPDSAAAMRACGRAAQSWWPVHDKTAMRHPVPLSFREEGAAAIGIVQFLTLNEPDRARLRTFHFRKSEDGWLWQADLAADDAGDAADSELRKWAADEMATRKNDWQKALFPEPVPAAELAAGSAPSAEEARETATSWLAAIMAGDFEAALPLINRLADPASPSETLVNLGADFKSARFATRDPLIGRIVKGGFWTLVQVTIDQETTPIFPVYPLIGTPDGPRIALEIDLFVGGNRGRAWLNNTSFERAGKLISPEAEAELRSLFQQLEKELAADQ